MGTSTGFTVFPDEKDYQLLFILGILLSLKKLVCIVAYVYVVGRLDGRQQFYDIEFITRVNSYKQVYFAEFKDYHRFA